jgi:hypothetical protein
MMVPDGLLYSVRLFELLLKRTALSEFDTAFAFIESFKAGLNATNRNFTPDGSVCERWCGGTNSGNS